MESEKKGMGCLGAGIGCAALVLVLVIAGGIFGYITLKKNLEPFVADTPVTFAEVSIESPEISDSLKERFDQFRDATDAGEPTDPLELTAEEINLLIAHHPDFDEIADHARVSIEGDQLTASVSMAIPPGTPMFKGKFVNGDATLRAEVVNGETAVYLTNLIVNGKEMPASVASQLGSENLLAEDPNALGNLEGIEIRDGKLILTGKSVSTVPETEEVEADVPAPELVPAPE